LPPTDPRFGVCYVTYNFLSTPKSFFRLPDIFWRWKFPSSLLLSYGNSTSYFFSIPHPTAVMCMRRDRPAPIPDTFYTSDAVTCYVKPMQTSGFVSLPALKPSFLFGVYAIDNIPDAGKPILDPKLRFYAFKFIPHVASQIPPSTYK